MQDSTTRFSNRVENYVKYRPSYPSKVIDLLISECHLTPDSIIADIGSGTGILADLLLQRGLRVIGIEPNANMRAAGEQFLQQHTRFASIDATAENTTLPDHSVQLIVAGQAFHWFDPDQTRAEWTRILQPGGFVALIWNIRREVTQFMIDYDRLIQSHNIDYNATRHHRVDADAIAQFFAPQTVTHRSFPNQQTFDRTGLHGRVLSSSYMPERGQPGYEELIAALDELWQRHERDGVVSFEYDTNVYYGRLT